MKFPKDFLWGTATSAHQVEGNNTNSDWWKWETESVGKKKFPMELSGEACDSYNRFEEDFDLCKTANNNAIRISIEWARLEPVGGFFDNKAFDHYRKVLQAAKNKGLTTFVTLHHFTNPLWFSKKGGWANFASPTYFSRYAEKCAQKLGDLIDVFTTINEPQVYALEAYFLGVWPPNRKNPFLALTVQLNFMRAHVQAYKKIKGTVSKPVGIVKNIAWYKIVDGMNFFDRAASKVIYFMNSDFFLKPISGYLDYIGLNFYFSRIIKNFRLTESKEPFTDMGWSTDPEGLYKNLIHLKKYNLPIYITENGVADSHDNIRTKYLKEMLKATGDALKDGVDVKGYFHWSLLDNFEWHWGYTQKFGLVEIDHKNNLKRIPRQSYYEYSKICANGIVE